MHHTNETRALAKNSFKENYRSSAFSCTLSSDLPCLTRIINRKLNISPKILLQNSVTKTALGDRSCGKHERVGGRRVSYRAWCLHPEQTVTRTWALKQRAGFANHISNEQWDTIREINVRKQHLGLLEWECKIVLRIQERFGHGC